MAGMSETLLAFLMLDGKVRQVCIGCSRILNDLGMIRVVRTLPIEVNNAPRDTYHSILYEIIPPYTLKLCQSAIRKRHVGEKWGA
jgi:hypothetical protein